MYGGSVAGTYDSQTFYGMAVDGQGDVYLQGIVTAPNLPTTTGSFQPACNLYMAGQCSNFFVAKFDPTKSGAASLIYATYIGGNEEKVSIYNVDASYYQVNDIAADSAGDAYFTGSSSVANYPTTSNAYSQSCVAVSTQACYGAAVFTKLDPTGSTLLYSTYIPETYDLLTVSPGGIAIDGSQVAYIEGVAAQDLSTTDGSTCVGCNDAPFVAAFDTTKSGAASLLYSEFIPLDGITALAADSAGNLYLGGEHYQNTLTWSGTVQTIPLNGFQTTTTNTAGIGPTFVRLNHAGVVDVFNLHRVRLDLWNYSDCHRSKRHCIRRWQYHRPGDAGQRFALGQHLRRIRRVHRQNRHHQNRLCIALILHLPHWKHHLCRHCLRPRRQRHRPGCLHRFNHQHPHLSPGQSTHSTRRNSSVCKHRRPLHRHPGHNKNRRRRSHLSVARRWRTALREHCLRSQQQPDHRRLRQCRVRSRSLSVCTRVVSNQRRNRRQSALLLQDWPGLHLDAQRKPVHASLRQPGIEHHQRIATCHRHKQWLHRHNLHQHRRQQPVRRNG